MEPRVTTREIQKSPNIGTAATKSISHDHLRVRKRCAKWIPHSLTDEQRRVRVELCAFMLRKLNGGRSELSWEMLTGDKTWIYRYDPETKIQSAVWLFPDESPPPKFKRSRSTQKKMVACFFRKSGHVATIPPKDRRRSSKFSASAAQRWESVAFFVINGNAGAHTAATPADFLNESQVQLQPHPPCSPDLSPCDFFFFPQVKKQLKGILFESPEDACREFTRAIEDIPRSTWAEKWNK